MQPTRRDLMTAGLGLATGAFATPAPTRAAADAAAAPALAVAAFGIRPDSGEDESARLIKAIEAAAAASQPLAFPAGHFVVGGLAIEGRHVHLLGAAGATRLKLAGRKDAFRVARASVSLAGLVFERDTNAADTDAGLLVVEDGGIDIVDCRFLSTGGNGLALRKCRGTVAACSFGGIAGDAVAGRECSGLTLRDNRFDAVKGSGIHLVSCSEAMISGNRLDGNRGPAILIEASHAALITGNLVTGEGGGIHVLTGRSPTGLVSVVNGNLVRGQMLGNTVATPGGKGIGIYVERETQVGGNIVEAVDIGIRIGTGKQQGDVNCTGNTVRDCRIGIGVSGDFDAGYVAISCNFIGRHKDGAIRAMNGDKPIGPDLTRASAESYRSLSIFGNAAP